MIPRAINSSHSSATSIIDLLPGCLAIIAAIFWLIQPFSQSDIFWHLASGRWIALHHAWPRIDPFSFTRHNSPWIDHSWLFDAVAFSAYRATGFSGILAIKILLILGTLAAVWVRLMYRQTSWVARWTCLIGIFWASRHGWTERADLVSIFGASVLLMILEVGSRRDVLRSKTVPLAALMVIWANSHGGFVLGLAIAVLWVAGLVVARENAVHEWILLIMLGALMTLINPYGIHLHTSLLHAVAQLRAGYISEWHRTPWNARELFWWGVFAYWSIWLWRVWKRQSIRWPETFVSLLLTYCAISQIRNVPFFCLGVFPWMVTAWTSPIQKATSWNSASERRIGLATSALLVILILVEAREVAIGLKKDVYPIDAVTFITAQKIPGPFFNEYSFGGYWLWQFGETRPVFIDGRLHMVDGYLELYQEMVRAQHSSPADWNQFLDHFGVRAAIVKYPVRSPIPSAFRVYFPRDRWALVYWDDTALIFLRREQDHALLIKKHEFQSIDPDTSEDDFIARASSSKSSFDALRTDVETNLRLHPASRRTSEFLTLLRQISRWNS